MLFIIILCFGCNKYKYTINYYDRENLINILKDNKYYLEKNIDKYLSYSILNNNIDNIVREVNVGLYRDYYININETDTSLDNIVLVNKYNCLKSDYIPDDLEEISNLYNLGQHNMLRKEAKNMFEIMANDALNDNIKLFNISAFRNYNYQEYIYNYNIMHKGFELTEKYVARAGCSEHQSGLSLDINSVNNSFKDTNEYKWLINNSYKYGFILRYPKEKERITGFSFEPWHFRYVGKEVALIIKDENITFDEYYAYYINN